MGYDLEKKKEGTLKMVWARSQEQGRVIQWVSQAARLVWAQLVRLIEASLNFILHTVEGLLKIVEWGNAATLNVVIYQDEFDSSV